MNEEIRKEFEKLYWLEYGEKKDLPYDLMFKRVQVNNQYSEDDVDEAWYWFSRSREAMKPIKLPDETDTSTCKSIEKEILHDGINHGIQQCREAIQQAGYEVK